MKKLLFTLVLLISFGSYSQEINKTNDGYTEVVEVELTKQEIHQKVNEWIAINYKSAQDVIQLNTEDKVILKGNFSADFRIQNFTFTYRIHNSLTFSIRDNKFKIDLVPNRASYEGFSTSSATTIWKDIKVLSAGNETVMYGYATMSVPDEVLELTFKQANIAFNNYKKNPVGDSNKSVDGDIEKLEKLKSLLDAGVLTQEEFDEKKKSILERI